MISLIHPSRSRPQQALYTLQSWQENMSLDVPVEYIMSLDNDDAYLAEYQEFPCDTLVIADNKNLVQAANNGAKIAQGDILVLVSDDFKCFKDWDKAIVEALEGRSGVLKTWDGIQRWIVTLPILTRDYYDSQGYLYHPDGKHMFVDTFMTHKADLEKKLIFRKDLVFVHDHYSKGGTKKDAVNIKADSTWQSGEEFYLKHCRNKFGLGNVDIFNLSKEAHQAGHVAWLKKKLHVR